MVVLYSAQHTTAPEGFLASNRNKMRVVETLLTYANGVFSLFRREYFAIAAATRCSIDSYVPSILLVHQPLGVGEFVDTHLASRLFREQPHDVRIVTNLNLAIVAVGGDQRRTRDASYCTLGVYRSD